MIAFLLITLATLLAERKRREDAKKKEAEKVASFQERFTALALRLRAEYHPKQRAFCASKAKRRAAKCTRRAGKTRGGCRETFARALEGSQRWVYCNATRAEAKRLAWRSDTRDGWRDLVEQLGLRVAKTRDEFDRNPACDILVNETDLTLDFRNGSQLAIFAADRPEDADKLRGGDKDGIWVDEAQKFPSLNYFVDDVATPMLAKPGDEEGELWLTGTPARTLAGLFFEITKELDQGIRKPGWEVHEFGVTDNPRYGKTPEERWNATAGKVLLSKGWTLEDPPPAFVREWLGKWTKGDALYVYAVHAKPPDTFAPSRVDKETGIYNHRLAAGDLPDYVYDDDGRRIRIRWFFALGADFGFDPAAFAWTLWAFSPDIADIYEMGSWKKHRQQPHAIREHLSAVWRQCSERIAVFVGDAGGAMAKSSIIGWRESTGLPIEEAQKSDKWTWIEHFNGELYASNVHYREGSMLLAEQKELQKRPAKAKPGETDVEVKLEEWAERTTSDGERCGNDVSDSALYPYRHLISRRLEFAAAPKTEAERLAREEEKMLSAALKSTRRAMESETPYDN